MVTWIRPELILLIADYTSYQMYYLLSLMIQLFIHLSALLQSSIIFTFHLPELLLEHTTMDFGELKHDATFVTRVTDFDQSLEEIQEQVKRALEIDVTKLTKEDRIKHELFLCYSTNTLYYLYLKINGVDVNEVGMSWKISRIAYLILLLFSAPDKE